MEPDERRAVIAHELGHIVHYDFAVMAVATTLLQILYEVYVWTRNIGGMRKKTHEEKLKEMKRARKRDKGGFVPLLIIALVSYVFYIIGRYIVLYLSRVREYYADEFAAKKTSPMALASALVKVAYGIVEAPDDYESRRLLRSTETLGIMNERVARAGVAFSEIIRRDPYRLGKVVAWDLYSPWAFILELGSTHPLTGKRIVRLLEMAGRPVHVPKPDVGKMYRQFAADILSYSAYIVFPVIGIIVAALIVSTMTNKSTQGIMEFFGGIMMGLGAALYFRKTYKYPGGEAKYTTIAKLLEDPYASPMRGKRVVLNGKVVGRGIPNQLFCEDVIVKDSTGIITANYESPLLSFGNLFFAVTKVDSLIGKDVRIEGWYFRGVAPRIDLHRITNGETIESCPYNIPLYSGIALFLLGILFIVMSL
ncbi:TPA: hypothetical protein EYP13_05240 [Candidatus Micrarchaeota archaeon]|nr:hypothetical protein [Candidatus Micrarchaeota archaeon]